MKYWIYIHVWLLCCYAHAASWYASPSGVGDGSLSNPWSLNVALTNTSILAGDVLYLRGGTYDGIGYVSTLTGTSDNYITVQSYPGEWAVVRDGLTGILGTAMSTTNTANITITNSSTATAAQVILMGSEQMQLNVHVSGDVWNVVRAWNGTTATTHSPGDSVIFATDVLTHAGDYTVFREFELTSTRTPSRIVGVGSTNHVGSGLNFPITGVGNKAYGLIVHNVGHPGIGFWQQGSNGEINGCLIWGNGMYDNNGLWTRGSAIYAQNTNGLATVKNCISFRNFTGGGQVYGETGPVRDFQFVGNIAFANGDFDQLQASSGSTATSNIWFVGNEVLGRLRLAYVSTGNSHQYVISNKIVNGSLQSIEHASSVYTNNRIFNLQNAVVSENTSAESGYRSTLLNLAALNVTWDYNTWYTGNGSSVNAWSILTADTNSGWVTFPNWQSISGFDLNSTCATNWPTNYLNVTVQPLDYDTNRWHICVINTDTNTTSTALDLSSQCGFTSGQRYRLRDAQNYFQPISLGIYSGGTITLPLNLTNVAVINGTLTHMTNKHTNVDNSGLFNAFVLERLAGSQPLRTRRTALGGLGVGL